MAAEGLNRFDEERDEGNGDGLSARAAMRKPEPPSTAIERIMR
jgi:hypothetical protein